MCTATPLFHRNTICERNDSMALHLRGDNDIKVFILYLMDKIGYPLDYDTLTTIVVKDEIVNYFDFAQCFAKLEDAGHIEKLPPDDKHPHARYTVTRTGRTVCSGLNSVLSQSVKEKGYRSAMRHLELSRRGAVVDQTIKTEGDNVLFRGTIKDPDGTALDISIRADSEYKLRCMQDIFADRPEVVLRGITALLTGDFELAFGESKESKYKRKQK